jgi:hypothetical protein
MLVPIFKASVACYLSRRDVEKAKEVVHNVDRFHKLNPKIPGVQADLQIATAFAFHERSASLTSMALFIYSRRESVVYTKREPKKIASGSGRIQILSLALHPTSAPEFCLY